MRTRRQAVALGLLACALALFVLSATVATPGEVLLTYHRHLADFVAQHNDAALALFALSYVVVTALGTPGSLVMTVAGGVLFGGAAGGIASILSATAGGAILFSAVRAGFADALARRVPRRLGRLAENFRQDGFFYLLFLRLTPLLPFFAINLIAAMAGLRLMTFVSATLIGIAPMNFALAFTGAGLQETIARQAETFLACKARGESLCPALSASDFLNMSIIAPIGLLAVIAIVPALVRRFMPRRRTSA